MDLEIDLSALQSKSSDFDSMNSNVKTICEDCNSSYLKKLSGTEISSLSSKLIDSVNRLEKGYNNSNIWLTNYNNELKQLESQLSSFSGPNMSKVEEFKSEFTDLFTKVTAPNWTTKAQNDRKKKKEEEAKAKEDSTETVEPGTMDEKKKAFIGDVNDKSKYYIDHRYPNMQKDLRCFNNQTGEELLDNQTIHMKVGETIVLTVALPYNAGVPKRIIRTTAADVSSQSDRYKITSSKSNISGDPNNIQYVNYQYNHWPSGVNLNTTYYEWIIHADKKGKRQISQTCEYESSAGIPKSMIGINVVID